VDKKLNRAENSVERWKTGAPVHQLDLKLEIGQNYARAA